MSKQLAEMFGALAEGLEQAASAARKIEGGYANAGAKSQEPAGAGVAGGGAGSAGKKAAAAPAVAAKSAGGGKKKPAAPTFDDVKAKLSELMEAKGKQAVKDLLSEFSAAKLADLSEDDYGDAVAKATELLNADEDDGSSGDDDDMFG